MIYIQENNWKYFVLHQKVILGVPQRGVNPNKVDFQSSKHNMLWVDPMQKQSAQSDHPAGRKLPKCTKSAKSDHILDIFSGQGAQIELIPFALFQASPDRSSEYPQHSIQRTLKIIFF